MPANVYEGPLDRENIVKCLLEKGFNGLGGNIDNKKGFDGEVNRSIQKAVSELSLTTASCARPAEQALRCTVPQACVAFVASDRM